MPPLLNSAMESPTGLGTDALSFSIGGVQVRLISADSRMRLGVTEETEYFRVDGGRADSEVRAAWADLGKAVPGEKIFDSGGLWQLYGEGPDYNFQFTSPAYGPLPYKQARFNADFSAGEVLLHGDYFDPSRTALPLEYPLDEVLVMHLLSLGRGVEVHACGVEDFDGTGYLFLGQSGDGKSTTARLWLRDPRVKILSDDRIILKVEAGTIWMYGTPWHGEAELACSMRTRLNKIFVLGRGAKNQMVPMTQPAAVSRMLAGSFVPFYSPGGLAFTLELLQQVTGAIPSAEFRFVPDERAVEFVRERAK